MTYTRQTLATSVPFEGVGLHSGLPVRCVVHPSQDGIVFRLGSTRVAARPENVTDTTRCTRLGEISTVEHLMSAFAALEITDAEVEVDAQELPAFDGSAYPYLENLAQVGVEQLEEVAAPDLFKRVFVQEEGTKIAIGKGNGHWKYTYQLDNRWPGEQTYECEDIVSCFATEIAPARTFALAEEVPAILQAGLARGLDDSSALILGIEGYKNPPRFENEPARHKLLDLVGDLYLAGIPIRFLNVAAERSGHASNVKAAVLLSQATAALS